MVDSNRTRVARAAAERALVRVVHHYGATPEFVVLGGLVPELLCAESNHQHTGTTDVDVQVDLEIACGTVNATRLEQALLTAEFEPTDRKVWRWSTDAEQGPVVVKFELLADLDDAPANATINFDDCESLGAVNLRGSGFAARDCGVREISARVGDEVRQVNVNVAGLAGYLLAKNAAARTRRKSKDWYDMAFVLIHNDAGGPEAAAKTVFETFGEELPLPAVTALRELAANFADHEAQGTRAYVQQMSLDHPDLDPTRIAADAITAVEAFTELILNG